MKEFETQEVRDSMFKQLILLLEEAGGHIFNKDEESKRFYSSDGHWYIEDNIYELMFPLEKERWPENFKNQYLEMEQMAWPQYTNYCYLMDIIAPPFIPYSLLHFGYAVVDGKLIKTTFFVVQTMVDYQISPQGMVIDPLAEYHGIKASFYVGTPLPDKKYIEEWMNTRKSPFEMYMMDVQKENEKKHQEKIRDSYFESYYLQMAYAPEWFPDELIEFAKKEKLHIPHQGW